MAMSPPLRTKSCLSGHHVNLLLRLEEEDPSEKRDLGELILGKLLAQALNYPGESLGCSTTTN